MYESCVEIDCARLRDNLRAILAALDGRTEPVLVVKAQAYGHGTGPVAACAARAGIRWFAVAHMREALQVRAAAPDARLVLLGIAHGEDVPILLEQRILPIVVSVEQAQDLAAAARAAGARLPVHLKLDTGMGRYGLYWKEAYEEGLAILRLPELEVEGLCTHFARVEHGEEDPAAGQAHRFLELAAAFEKAAGRHLFKHMSNSRALLLHPEWDLDGVRPGIIAYGYGASDDAGRIRTRPVLEWKTRVLQVRRVPAHFPVGYYSTYVTPAPTTLAVLGLGYADGYLRALSNRGHVLIRGRRCRVVGRISMNWMTVDAGPYSEVQTGDEAVLIGRQGNQKIWADELAVICHTIPYEILAGINPLLERRYLHEQETPPS